MTWCRTALTVVMSCFVLDAAAQFPITRSFDLRSGQQRPKITCTAQDEIGRLWAGSDIGLLRTDGEYVELVLRTEADNVNAIVAHEGLVYAAISSGVIIHCTSFWCDTILVDPSLIHSKVSAMAVGQNGRIWLATYGSGVWVIENGRRSVINSDIGLPDDHVNDIALLSNGNAVVATDQGLAICSALGVNAVYGQNEGAPDNLILSLAVEDDGRIWAGTDRKGVFRWSPHAEPDKLFLLDPQWQDGPVKSIAVNEDLICMATVSNGTVLFDRTKKGGRYEQHAVVGERIMPIEDLFVASDGTVIWCNGTDHLFRSDPAVLFVPDHESVDLHHITALTTDHSGDIWFATPEGLFTHPAGFGARSFITRMPLSLPTGRSIVSLTSDPNGTLWAATFGSGVYAIDTIGDVEHFNAGADGLANENVLAVRYGDGKVWCATLEGLCAYDIVTREWTDKVVPGHGFVYDVMPLPHGQVVAATDGNGAVRVNEQAETPSKAVGPDTYYMLAKIDEAVWAAGPRSGFCKVEGSDADCFGNELVPFDGELFAMVSTKHRLLAFGNTGVAAYEPRTGIWTNMTSRTGLGGAKAELNVACTEADGTIWYGCDKGLIRIRATDAHFASSVNAFILGARVGNSLIPNNGKVDVPYDRNDLTIMFTAPDLNDPGSVRFAYQLIGHMDRPIHTRDREVSFTDLPAGNYSFEVTAYSANGSLFARDPGKTVAVISIQVEQVWWKLPWVIAIGFAALVVAVLGFVRTREKRMQYRERMEQEKVHFQLEALRSQVDPHFLFNSFNTLVDLIETDTGKAVDHVDQLSTFFRNILQVRDKDLITISEELDLLGTYFGLEQRRFGDSIALDVQIPKNIGLCGIVPLTLQLLVENALKHNTIRPKDVLRITIRSEGDALILSNPIQARHTAAPSTGFGLESIRKRYAALSSVPVRIDASNGHFTVHIPLIRYDP